MRYNLETENPVALPAENREQQAPTSVRTVVLVRSKTKGRFQLAAGSA